MKTDAWEMKFPFGAKGLFSGANWLLVLGRGGLVAIEMMATTAKLQEFKHLAAPGGGFWGGVLSKKDLQSQFILNG